MPRGVSAVCLWVSGLWLSGLGHRDSGFSMVFELGVDGLVVRIQGSGFGIF